MAYPRLGGPGGCRRRCCPTRGRRIWAASGATGGRCGGGLHRYVTEQPTDHRRPFGERRRNALCGLRRAWRNPGFIAGCRTWIEGRTCQNCRKRRRPEGIPSRSSAPVESCQRCLHRNSGDLGCRPSFPHDKTNGRTIRRGMTKFSQWIRVLRRIRPGPQSNVGLGGCEPPQPLRLLENCQWQVNFSQFLPK